jgi:hypothetical protein
MPFCRSQSSGEEHGRPARSHRLAASAEQALWMYVSAFLNRPKADVYIHKACSADAAKRWLRAGRPCSSPLDWLRQNGIRWTGVERNGRPAAEAAATAYRR